MEPTPAVIAAYEAALPDDPRVERKKMFGTPCAFVNRQMFFGTFGDTLVARIGPGRVEVVVAAPGLRVFTPREGSAWRDYVQLDSSADAGLLRELAAEAFAWTLRLPAKGTKPKGARRAAKKR